MQDRLMHAQAQPFIKLAQSNMELLTRFSSSPEMTAQATSLFQQATESATKLMQSGAFARMMQGMMKNYSVVPDGAEPELHGTDEPRPGGDGAPGAGGQRRCHRRDGLARAPFAPGGLIYGP